MTKTKGKKPPLEDQDQSRRFLEAARDLETSDGGLSPTDAEKAFERLMDKAAPPKRPAFK